MCILFVAVVCNMWKLYDRKKNTQEAFYICLSAEPEPHTSNKGHDSSLT